MWSESLGCTLIDKIRFLIQTGQIKWYGLRTVSRGPSNRPLSLAQLSFKAAVGFDRGFSVVPMGKIRLIRSKLSTVAPRISYASVQHGERERDRRRDRHDPCRGLYKTARWQRLRLTILTRDLFTCRLCGRIEVNTSQLVCDHVEPHGGDVERFWAGPFQTLCKLCHDSDKQRLEKAARPRRWPC